MVTDNRRDYIDRRFGQLGMTPPGREEPSGLQQGDPLGSPGRGSQDPLSRDPFGGDPLAEIASQTGRDLPARLAQIEEAVPRAVEDGGGFMEQFMYGVTSPVMDTLSAIGVTDPRPMPDDFRGTAGNIIGSIVGWTVLGALTKGAAPAATLAAGGATKTAFAQAGASMSSVAGKAGIGLGRVAAETAIRGTVYGGLSNAHWSLGQRDRPVGKDALTGALFGLGMGAAGARLSRFARDRQWTKEQASQFLRRKTSELGDDMLSTTDRHSLSRALGINVDDLDQGITQHLDSRESRYLDNVFKRMQYRAQEVEGPLPSSARIDDQGIRIGGADFWKKPVSEQVDMMVNAFRNHPNEQSIINPIMDIKRATKGLPSLKRHGFAGRTLYSAAEKSRAMTSRVEIPDHIKNRYRNIREASESLNTRKFFRDQMKDINKIAASAKSAKDRIRRKYNNDWAQVPMQDRERIAELDRIVQDLTWEQNHHITGVLSGDPTVGLPPISAIDDPRTKDVMLKEFKRRAKEGEDLGSRVFLHRKLKDVIDRANQESGAKNYTSSRFLPEQYKREFDRVWKEIVDAGDSPRILAHPLAEIPLPENVTASTVNEFIRGTRELPTGYLTSPASVQDVMTAQREMTPFIGRLFAPVRHVLGEGPTRQLREAVRNHKLWLTGGTDAKGKQVKGKLQFLRDMNEDLGLDTAGKKQEWGTRAFRTLERRQMEGTTVNEEVTRAGRILRETGDINDAARAGGVSKKQAGDAKTWLDNLLADQETREFLQRTASAEGVDIESFLSRMLADHMYDYRIRRAFAFGSDRLSNEARKFNVSPKELKWLGKARRELDDGFIEAGLDPTKVRTAYMPRFRENVGESSEGLFKKFNQLGARRDEVNKVLWANEMPREAHSNVATLNMYDEDLYSAVTRYFSGLSKRKHFEGPISNLNKHYSKINMSESRRQVYEELKGWMVGRPSWHEKEMDRLIHTVMDTLNKSEWTGPKPTQAMSSFLAELQYTAGMGYNPWMPIRNMTQKLLALPSITDDGNPLHGLQWMYRYKRAKARGDPEALYLQNFNDTLRHRQYTEGLELDQSAMANLARKFGFKDATADKIDKWTREQAMRMFQWSDRSNVEDTFGAKMMYLMNEKGAPVADAAELARATTQATQFMYGFDSPMLYKTPIGRQIGIFQSWPINWAFHLWNQGTHGQMQQAVYTVATMAVGAELLSMTGMNFRSIAPTETVRGILPLSMLEGERNWPIAMRASSSILDYARGLAAGDDEAIDSAIDNLTNTLTMMRPAGLVTDRTIQFVDQVRHDWKQYEGSALTVQTREDRERLQYEVTPSEAVRGWLGPTVEARQRARDWERVASLQSDYRRMRKDAVDAFIDGDYSRFEQLQEQLVLNFGRYIKPEDIRYEKELRQMSDRERQSIGLPQELRDPLLKEIHREGRLRDEWEPGE